ncbi:MAG: SemiSWEET family sugar transporter [Alphaproteobacteria bacterium]
MLEMLSFPHIIGFVAGFLMSVSFIPQAIKSIKTKDTKSLSLPSYLMYVTACVLWLSYGVALGSPPMILWNAITVGVAGMVLYTKIKYG